MIRVSVRRAGGSAGVPPREVGRWVRAALRSGGITGADVTVVFVDDRLSRRLHRRWFGRDTATDVMAFPLSTGETREGELYVNTVRGRRQARRFGASPRQEVTRLVVHGTLHLAGHDDRKPSAARRMRAREDALVEALTRRPGRKT